MSKRGAANQLTRENFNNNSDDESNGPNNNIFASAEVMNKRKIAMPKRKMTFSNKFNNPALKAETSFANAFKSTTTSTTTNTNNSDDKPAKLKALNEQFKSKILDVLSSDPCSNLSSLFSKYTQYLNDINNEPTIKTKEPMTSITSSFGSIPQKQSEVTKTTQPKVPSSGFTFTLSKPAPEINSTTTKNDEPLNNKKESPSPASSSSSSDSENEEIKIEGPKFTINTKPITEDSVFSFGPKKANTKNDSDSEDDIKIKGPQFTFSGTIKSDVFKLKPKETDKESESNSTDKETKTDKGETKPFSFSFSNKTTDSEQKSEDKNKPVFTVGQNLTSATSTTATTATTATTTNSTNLETSSNEVKDGRDETKEKTSKPSFSFSIPTKSKEDNINTQKATTAFNFLSKQDQKLENAETTKDEVKKPSFSFNSIGSTSSTAPNSSASFSAFDSKLNNTTTKEDEISALISTKTDEKKPSFTFNQSISTTKPTFSFGTNDKTTDSSKLSFTFGQSSTTSSTENKEDDQKPSFTFDQSSITSNSKNDASTDSKPSFTFGIPTSNQKSETKPTFTFGNSTTSFNTPTITTDQNTKNKPTFTFGINSSSTPAPSFNFSKTSTGLTNHATTLSGGFKFNLPFEQKTTPFTTQPTEKKETDKIESGATEQSTVEKEQGQNDTTTEQESSTPIKLQNGEEDEINLFSQRVKLMIFNTETKSYDSRGVGEMKLLQNKEDKSKVRLLCRSDGMGNILLNTSIVKSFNYTPLTEDNENLVKTPTVGTDGKLTTYIVKFKQKADGRSFIKSIEDAKKGM
ncbi:nucleoporin NUP2 PWA37_004848 [Arxiozyma heterogenica]|uniref:nucleoporin NUP2 n=1 Tax=Arxiozyma heterogenica TaxID=278026 RepID=UPI002EE02350